MMTENCDKYVKKAKYALISFSTAVIIGVLKIANIIDMYFGNSMDHIFITWIVLAGVLSLMLSNKYIMCLSKYKRRL